MVMKARRRENEEMLFTMHSAHLDRRNKLSPGPQHKEHLEIIYNIF